MSKTSNVEWITVHPNGKEHKGQPIPVEEGKTKGEAVKDFIDKHSKKSVDDLKKELLTELPKEENTVVEPKIEPKNEVDKKSKNKYGEFLKQKHDKDMDFFFGKDNWHKVTNKYYEIPKRVISNDEIYLVTNNLTGVKGNPVLVVGNNKAVYLKEWQIKNVYNYYDGIGDSYIVKLNRKYFKPYEFKSGFDNFSFDKDETFDDLLKVAQEQEEANIRFKI